MGFESGSRLFIIFANRFRTMQLAEFRKPTDSDDEECSEAEAPLSQRALALQERVFSSRILWYDGNQLRWYCRQSQYSEELPLLPPEGEGQQRSKTYLPNCPFVRSVISIYAWVLTCPRHLLT
jgi:hypothetical protein